MPDNDAVTSSKGATCLITELYSMKGMPSDFPQAYDLILKEFNLPKDNSTPKNAINWGIGMPCRQIFQPPAGPSRILRIFGMRSETTYTFSMKFGMPWRQIFQPPVGPSRILRIFGMRSETTYSFSMK